MNLVKVTWRDIAGIAPDEGAWMSKLYVLKQAKNLYESKYVSVGKIVAENKNYIVLAATWDEQEPEYCDVSMIMKSVIIRIERLKD